MRKSLLHKIFLLFILIPINAFATCQNATTTEPACISYDGCGLNDYGIGGVICETCVAGYYNNSTTDFTSCKSCESDYDFNTLTTGKIWNSSDNSTGNTECPWICTDDWYQSGDSCVHCPTGATSPAGSDDVNDCICPTGTHLAYNNGTYSCEQCSCTPPENGSCTTTYNETTGCQTTITCGVGYYKTETSGTVSCTACPAGTTTDTAGATTKSACHMTQNTKFCDANGENCMQLLSGANNINQ